MNTIRAVCLTGLAVALANCTQSETSSEEESDQVTPSASETIARATLASAEGVSVGTVDLHQVGDELRLDLTVDGIDPGEHAFHLHTTGLCEAPDFTSAGGHLNPFGKSHGKLSENGKHLGDLPNITIEAGASLSESFELEQGAEEAMPEIFDEDGTAVMIHAGPDDYISDPAGAAGPRVACGVLTRTD